MGRFSTTVQVKNRFERTNFASLFCDTMKKRGLVKCSEDEAAQSYLLAFGEGWATLASGEYNENPQKSCDDARNIAAALNTSAFSVEVVDSDFALLKLCASNGGRDEVIVGDSSGYGIEKQPRGTQAFWQPLLAEGRTWEQFTETAAKNAAFAEDTLAELAEILGIEPRYICADFYDIAEKAGGNVMAVYFRKAAKAKSMSLNAAFKQVFGEALEPLGFKLIKSKYPYFVRVVDNEIIHTITLAKIPAHYNEFCIKCGVSTVYCGSVDYSMNPHSVEWLNTVYGVYGALAFNGKLQRGTEEFSDVITFSCNEDTLISTLERALKMVQKVVIPLLNGVTDIEACTEYYSLNNRFFSLLSLKDIYENVGFALKYPKDKECEGLLWLVLNNRSCYERQCKQWEQSEIKRVKLFEQMSHISKSDYLANISNIVSDSLSFYDKVFSDKVWLEKAYEELGRRRKTNTQTLISYGFYTM